MTTPRELWDALPEARRAQAHRLDAIFRDVSGFAPIHWQRNLVGYGTYDYTYPTGHSGRFIATGFAMNARDIALHILPGYDAYEEIAARMGPHRRGKSCWYISGLDHIDETALRELIARGLKDLAALYPIRPT